MLSTRDPPQNKEHIQNESEGLEKDIPHRDQKKAGVAILISDKIDFKTKAVKRDKEGHYIMATHSNSLAWKIPWMEEPGRLQSMGSQRVKHN